MGALVTLLPLPPFSLIVSLSFNNGCHCFREAMNDRYERAAAVAVFQGDIKLAISSLKEGAQAKKHGTGECAVTMTTRPHPQLTTPLLVSLGYDLNLIALSLSGYSTEHSLWQDTCTSIKRQIRHPYLRAIFSFLCAIAVPEELNMVLVRVHCVVCWVRCRSFVLSVFIRTTEL